MKKIFALLVVMTPFFANAQNHDTDSLTDSTLYYRKEVGEAWRHVIDSMNNSKTVLKLRDYHLRKVHRTNNYSSFTLYADLAHNDYTTFNNTLKQLGFPVLNNLSKRFGMGVSIKNGNTMFNCYFFTIGGSNTSSKNDEFIRTSFSNLLQLDLGYDVLNIERVSIYPFAGLSMRFSELVYSKHDDANPDYTNITNTRTDGNWNRLESVRVGYQYGLGVDYAFAYIHDKTFKFIAFAKAGVNKPFREDIYKSDGIPDYKAGIKQGDWVLTFGFKFATKH